MPSATPPSIHLHPLGHHTAWMFDAIGLRQQRHGARQLHDALVAVAPAAFLHDLLFKDALVRQPGDGECIPVIGNLNGNISPRGCHVSPPENSRPLSIFASLNKALQKGWRFHGGNCGSHEVTLDLQFTKAYHVCPCHDLWRGSPPKKNTLRNQCFWVGKIYYYIPSLKLT